MIIKFIIIVNLLFNIYIKLVKLFSIYKFKENANEYFYFHFLSANIILNAVIYDSHLYH